MINKQNVFASKYLSLVAFVGGLVLAIGGSAIATSLGTNLSVDGTGIITGASTFTGTSLHTGLATMTNGYVSQASSTVVGAFSIASTTTISPLSIATSTPAGFAELAVNGDLILASTGTTTATIASASASRGGCINLRATDGTMVRIYATSSPTAVGDANTAAMGFKNLIVEAGSCQ